MEVYEFNKSYASRYNELRTILESEAAIVPLSEIRSMWSYFLEALIEPTGWQAIWCLSRITCEELNIIHPTIVCGTVENVLYKELKCYFKITAVEDDDLHLPEFHEAPLIDIWPTKLQENSELLIDRTADCIDQLRFFYNNIWMPWDNDDESLEMWEKKNLICRLKFFYELNSKTSMNRSLATYIRDCLDEARDIQLRRENLEMELSDNETDDEHEGEDNCIRQIIKLHMRLNTIRNEMDVLQNPSMRKYYEEILWSKKNLNSNLKRFLVTKQGNIDEQIEFLNLVKSSLHNDKDLYTCSSLQEALNLANSSDSIFIPPGNYSIRFLERFNGGGLIKTILPTNEIADKLHNAVVSADREDWEFIRIDGDFTIENVNFDCSKSRTGFLIRGGNIKFKNCKFFNDKKSSISQAINVMGKNSVVELQNCIIENFSIGISLKKISSLKLSENTIIQNCDVGIDLEDDCFLDILNSKIINSSSRGIYFTTTNEKIQNEKKKIYNSFEELTNLDNIKWDSLCEFANNKYGNIVIYNNMKSIFNLNKGDVKMEMDNKSDYEDERDLSSGYENEYNLSEISSESEFQGFNESGLKANESVVIISD